MNLFSIILFTLNADPDLALHQNNANLQPASDPDPAFNSNADPAS
jgi:hypothetical protein